MDKLEQAILLGATYELAAMYAGISEKTFERWRMQAATATPESPLGQLRERLRHAEGRAAINWLAHIEKAAMDGDFRASAWKLERRWPEQYGRVGVQKLAFTDPTGEHNAIPQLQIILSQEPAPPALPPPALEAGE